MDDPDRPNTHPAPGNVATEKLRALLAKATPGPWEVIEYDCGDTPHYDHNGPCPSIQARQADACVVHWDGFKQEYWSAANGDQKQIETNAALIAEAINALPDLLAAQERAERLASAEAAYRKAHDLYGGGDMRTGRAWDDMRQAGDAVRAALETKGEDHG